jgi:hypothetical protein
MIDTVDAIMILLEVASEQLLFLLVAADGKESGLQFLYGSESQGPPGDVCHFITSAVSLTEPRYQQKKNGRRIQYEEKAMAEVPVMPLRSAGKGRVEGNEWICY